MSKVKTPFNWVGNKYKYIDLINDLVCNKSYKNVFDLFMGSGSIILNIDVSAERFVGNDKIKLLPNIYQELAKNKYTYNLEDIENILNRFNRFSQKEDYYIFRDYWNSKYLNDIIDRGFIMETILLLKMCSNSMVRFNPKGGYFNQGFRGLGKKQEFFTDTMKQLCVESVNALVERLGNYKFKFLNVDFLENNNFEEDSLIILDPPYILRSDMYDTDWSKEHEDKLNNLISNTKNDFIYFNYLERDGVINEDLHRIIQDKGLRVIEINNKSIAGQARSKNETSVKEVIITNIHKV